MVTTLCTVSLETKNAAILTSDCQYGGLRWETGFSPFLYAALYRYRVG